jgi:hypothetical protein
MKRAYYETPKASRLMRFFWKAAGGDRYLLERATYSDQIKYMCLGGIIIATGVMAALAGGYAFYTIFCPKTADGELMTSAPHVLMAFVFGIIWGLIIFNIDRFIVTSTGKGDGTEKITKDELIGAIPRILMGAIIAVTISKPIEIRMFQSEIQAELIKKKGDQENAYKIGVENRHKGKLEQLEKDIDKANIEIKLKRDALTDANTLAITKCGRNNPSCPSHIGVWNLVKAADQEYKDVLNRINPKLIGLNGERDTTLAIKKRELLKSQSDGQKLDGLKERISIIHDIAPWISLFITLLFLAIELTPIFFKLMLSKTTYDYLAENRDDLMKAEYGIEVKYDYYQDKKGIERHLVINHEAERVIYEKIKTTDIQKELTDYALNKYKDREKKKIDENLDNYIKGINPEDNNANA